jgi:hypothetical protein
MQGRLKLPISECIKEYRRLGERIFGHPRPFHAQNKRYMRSKYDADDYRDIISDLVEQVNGEPQSPQKPRGMGHYTWKFIKVRGKRVGRMVKRVFARHNADGNENASELLDESRIFKQLNNSDCKTLVSFM